MTELAPKTYLEEAIEPSLPVIDGHHHLFPPNGAHGAHGYLRDELDQDLNAGHNVIATVFIDCEASYRETGPRSLAPVGETEWVIKQRTGDGIMSGIVPHADMFLGAEVREVLEAHREAGGDLVKGIRHNVAWDRHDDTPNARRGAGEHALADPTFRAGVAQLAGFGMSFETWLYFNQLHEMADLARAFPDIPMILNHIGGPVVVGSYAGRRDEVLEVWRRELATLVASPNVFLKVGGIGFPAFVETWIRSEPRSSEWLAEYWGPEIRHMIDTLGPARCMFESNYPADRPVMDYVTIWNTFKRVSAGYSEAERTQLFEGTARAVYRL